jgi:dephospho-CoA kinase
MYIIGLTGGIASGKSSVAEFLKAKADAVIDADEIAKDVMAPGTDAYERLVEKFGTSIIGSNGRIDRPGLGNIVFSDRPSLEFLNGLTHPLIIKRIEETLQTMRQNPRGPKTLILRAPLLIEVGMTGMVDTVVLVVADERTKIDRLIKYRGLTEEKARDRIRSQLPDEQKFKFADHVVTNNGTKSDLQLEVDRLWRKIAESDIARNA